MSGLPPDHGLDLRPDHQIGVCPVCGLPRWRTLRRQGLVWSPCGTCEAFAGHTHQVMADWWARRERGDR